MYNKYYSLPDFIIQCIEEVHAIHKYKKTTALIYEHHQLMGRNLEYPNKYLIKYRRFIESYPPNTPFFIVPLEQETLHELLIPKLKEMQESDTNFVYDMDKLKNFISYVNRYAMSMELLRKYIPEYFLTKYPGTLIECNGTNPIELYATIESKFKEEIPLIKKYFLMVKLHDME